MLQALKTHYKNMNLFFVYFTLSGLFLGGFTWFAIQAIQALERGSVAAFILAVFFLLSAVGSSQLRGMPKRGIIWRRGTLRIFCCATLTLCCCIITAWLYVDVGHLWPLLPLCIALLSNGRCVWVWVSVFRRRRHQRQRQC